MSAKSPSIMKSYHLADGTPSPISARRSSFPTVAARKEKMRHFTTLDSARDLRTLPLKTLRLLHRNKWISYFHEMAIVTDACHTKFRPCIDHASIQINIGSKSLSHIYGRRSFRIDKAHHLFIHKYAKV